MYINALTLYYAGRRLAAAGFPFASRVTDALTFLLFNSSIPSSALIGPGSRCEHRGVGVVIHPEARIGSGCRINSHVVVGGAGKGRTGVPEIGRDVVLSTGAKILGPVKVGDRAVIGANAVVLSDIPADATAVGVPAKVISTGGRSH